MPGVNSDNIYIVAIDGIRKSPTMHKVVHADQLHKLKLTTPHNVHCIPSGDVIISCLGDKHGNGTGSFIILDGKTFDIKGKWQTDGCSAEFGYDFWYQPRYNIMISTEWGAPSAFKSGFNPKDVQDGKYGHALNLWNWNEKKFLGKIELGEDGLLPLEIRFLHNPEACEGYVGCALSSNIFRFYKNKHGDWVAQKVISVPQKKVVGWMLPQLPGLITDIIISLDDKYLYHNNWAQGTVCQYDITDTAHPKLVAELFLGGIVYKGGPVKYEGPEQPKDQLKIKGKIFQGGPQMLQLSLDGKRLYVTNSLYSSWDKQFYPDLVKKGAMMVQLDVDTVKGGLTPNCNFLVDFGEEPNGPVLAHEMRFPGTDCTSDIWI